MNEGSRSARRTRILYTRGDESGHKSLQGDSRSRLWLTWLREASSNSSNNQTSNGYAGHAPNGSKRRIHQHRSSNTLSSHGGSPVSSADGSLALHWASQTTGECRIMTCVGTLTDDSDQAGIRSWRVVAAVGEP